MISQFFHKFIDLNALKCVSEHTFTCAGPEKDVVGRQRTFTVQLSCKEALDLKKGSSYLIMGHAKDIELEGGK